MKNIILQVYGQIPVAVIPIMEKIQMMLSKED
jgi:hypothetical protein